MIVILLVTKTPPEWNEDAISVHLSMSHPHKLYQSNDTTYRLY